MRAIDRLYLQPTAADNQDEFFIFAFGEELPNSVKLRFPSFGVAEIRGDAFCRNLFHGRVKSAKVLRQLTPKLHRCLVRLRCATGFHTKEIKLVRVSSARLPMKTPVLYKRGRPVFSLALCADLLNAAKHNI